MSAPLYVNPVIGYRSWWVNSKTTTLDARIIKTPWESENKTVAECVQKNNSFWAGRSDKEYDVPFDHVAPTEGCSCGLYAFHDIKDAKADYGRGLNTVLGAAIFWGEIVVHTAGFKAQYGRPIALVDHRGKGKRELGWASELEKIVECYNIPVVPASLLGVYAETFGEPLGCDYLDEK